MHILFKDDSTVDVLRIHKMRDFETQEVRVNIDLVPGTDVDEVAEKDFSDILVKRLGMPDVQLEGFELTDISEMYEDHATTVSMNLTKNRPTG